MSVSTAPVAPRGCPRAIAPPWTGQVGSAATLGPPPDQRKIGFFVLSPLEGRRVGPYEAQDLLGAGGMGEVYRARDTRLDRAVAKLVAAATEKQLTEAGVVLGTATYMAPEQVRGAKTDGRSDLFSLGCVLYEMLGGRRPFVGASVAETLASILREEPAPLPAPEPLPGLERVVRRCLEKAPALRFQSTDDLVFALEGLLSVPAGASAVGASGAEGDRPRGRRGPPSLCGGGRWSLLRGSCHAPGRAELRAQTPARSVSLRRTCSPSRRAARWRSPSGPPSHSRSTSSAASRACRSRAARRASSRTR